MQRHVSKSEVMWFIRTVLLFALTQSLGILIYALAVLIVLRAAVGNFVKAEDVCDSFDSHTRQRPWSMFSLLLLRSAYLVDDLGKVGITKPGRQGDDAGLQAQVDAPFKLLP